MGGMGHRRQGICSLQTAQVMLLQLERVLGQGRRKPGDCTKSLCCRRIVIHLVIMETEADLYT